jgi:hypothetical protein
MQGAKSGGILPKDEFFSNVEPPGNPGGFSCF